MGPSRPHVPISQVFFRFNTLLCGINAVRETNARERHDSALFIDTNAVKPFVRWQLEQNN